MAYFFSEPGKNRLWTSYRLPVVFVLYNQSMQMRRNMIRNRVSFIVPENQLYLPELEI